MEYSLKEKSLKQKCSHLMNSLTEHGEIRTTPNGFALHGDKELKHFVLAVSQEGQKYRVYLLASEVNSEGPRWANIPDALIVEASISAEMLLKQIRKCLLAHAGSFAAHCRRQQERYSWQAKQQHELVDWVRRELADWVEVRVDYSQPLHERYLIQSHNLLDESSDSALLEPSLNVTLFDDMYIQLGQMPAIPMLDWIQQNLPELSNQNFNLRQAKRAPGACLLVDFEMYVNNTSIVRSLLALFARLELTRPCSRRVEHRVIAPMQAQQQIPVQVAALPMER